MENFPGNSHSNPLGDKSPKKERPKKDEIEKVVSTEVIQRKKSLGRRFKNIFIGGEFKGALRYITGDVLLPALRNMVVDATTKGIERVIYGDQPRRRFEPGRPRVSYNSPVDRYARGSSRAMLPDQPPHATSRGRRETVGEIIIHSRDEAEVVLERLADIIEKYDVASIADLH
jgi:hypothetical protein